MSPAETALEEIKHLVRLYGHKEYGEAVTQLAHMQQTAQLAIDNHSDDEVVLAAYLHDIGHLLAEDLRLVNNHYGHTDHCKLGAIFLRKLGFSRKVQLLVKGHVDAKRYLAFKEQGYMDKLSNASLNSLALQGGPMQSGEARLFEQSEYFHLKLKLRRWDEGGKNKSSTTIDMEDLDQRIIRHFNHQLKSL